MSGITSGVGLFSGIDTQSLIQQLLAVEARPRDLAQQRVLQLQQQQAAYLDINSKLGALRSAAKTFRIDSIFDSMGASSSDTSVLTATASTSATPGSYSFIVDRLVSSQQLLSKGFVDQNTTALNASSFTFESAQGRLDRDIALADLNDGQGVKRGKIVITQGSNSATVDLSKAVTVNDVLDAINASGLDVTATVEGGAFKITGGSDFSIANASGYTTADSLGIAGSSSSSVLTGTTVYQMSTSTTLAQLNDGNGVFIGDDVGESRYDFSLDVKDASGTPLTVNVNIGSIWQTIDGELTETAGKVSTVQGVLDRINTALSDAGVGSDISASLSNGKIVITDVNGNDITINEANSTSTTAADLGLSGTGTGGTLTGKEVLAGLNTTLVSKLNGGSGIDGTTGSISFTARDGTNFSVDVSSAVSVSELIATINNDASNGGKIVASLNDTGNGLKITDTTGGSSNLIITSDTADALGISTDPAGVANNTVDGTSLQHQYLSMATRVDSLNGGNGIGTGEIRFTDGNSVSFTVDIGSDTTTVFDLIKEINGQANAAGANLEAAINDKGDGIIIREISGNPAGSTTISVEDVTGNVAGNLRIEGTAAGTGASNVLDGSAEVTVSFDATDTLQDIVNTINNSKAGVSASIINDGTGSNPYRLNLTATATGSAGRFIVDDGGFGLDLTSLDKGNDALAFYGSTDPASAVLLTSSTNTLDNVISGVSIDLTGTSSDPVTVNVTRDNNKIISSINAFIDSYNALVDRISFVTRYDPETQVKGTLLGDSLVSNLRASLGQTVLANPIGVDDEYDRLTDVGIGFTDGGKLTLDEDKLRSAMDKDFTAVKDLFAARELIPQDSETDLGNGISVKNTDTKDQFSKLGIIFQFEELADTYLDSVDGIFKNKDDTINDQIDLQKKRIEQFNVLLESKRKKLEFQFLNMEKALAALSSQQNALASLSQIAG